MKMFFPFLLAVVAVVSVASVGADWCYQESANASTSCGGLSTGSYALNGTWVGLGVNVTDGDWDTRDIADGVGYSGLLYVNYSKPTNFENNSAWQIKSGVVRHNATITRECLAQEPIQLRIESRFTNPGNNLTTACYNGSDWVVNNTGTGIALFEEAMYWNITDARAPTFPGQHTVHTDGGTITKEEKLGISINEMLDNFGFSHVWVEHNLSGHWQNESYFDVQNPDDDNSASDEWGNCTNINANDADVPCYWLYYDANYTAIEVLFWFNATEVADNHSWKFRMWANDSYNNVNHSDYFHINLSNTPPNITSVTVTPSPANATTDLTCNYTEGADKEGDTTRGTFYMWFEDGMASNYTNPILGADNTSGSEEWICEVKLYDGFDNASLNSSTVVVGDSEAPIMENFTFTGATEVGDVASLRADCSDSNSSIDSVKFWVYSELDSGSTYDDNVTASIDSGNTYLAPKSLNAEGVWAFRMAWCEDSSGNVNVSYVDLNVTVTDPPPVSGGSGGGGGRLTIIEDEGSPILNFGVSRVTFTVMSLPESVVVLEKDIRVRNEGTEKFVGEWEVSDNLDGLVSVEFCDVGGIDCGEELILEPGGSRLAKVSAEIGPELGEGFDGVLSLKGRRGDVFELDVVVDRLPGYAAWGFLEGDGFPGPLAALAVYCLFGLLLYGIYVVAKG